MNRPWRIIVRTAAANRIKRLPPDEKKRVKEAVDKLAEDPRNTNIKSLKARPEWSMRIGRWRILFRMDFDEKTIVITDFGPRGDIYKK